MSTTPETNTNNQEDLLGDNPFVDSPEKRDAAKAAADAKAQREGLRKAREYVNQTSGIRTADVTETTKKSFAKEHPKLTTGGIMALAIPAALGLNAATGHPFETQMENLTTPDAVIDYIEVPLDDQGWAHSLGEAFNHLKLDQPVPADSIPFNAQEMALKIPNGVTSVELLLVDEGATGKVELVIPTETKQN